MTIPRHALVTGGAGFIGSHLVERLLAEGWRVTVVDNFDPFYDPAVKRHNLAEAAASAGLVPAGIKMAGLPPASVAAAGAQSPPRGPGRPAAPTPIPGSGGPAAWHGPDGAWRWRLVEADLREPGALDPLAAAAADGGTAPTPGVIVHLAAKVGVRPSIDHPVAYHQANVTGTQHLLEWARRCGVGQFVFASSSSVYGVNPRVPWREEDRQLLPISPYASTKISGELLGHVYAHLFGIRLIVLRLFTVIGPRQRPDLALPRFVRCLREGRPIPCYGDGTTSRDYTYVGDIVAGLRAAMDYTASPYEVINLGNSRAVALTDFVATLAEAMKVTPRLERLPEQMGDVPRTRADIGRAGRLLGWAPRVSFEEGIRRFVEWFAGGARV